MMTGETLSAVDRKKTDLKDSEIFLWTLQAAKLSIMQQLFNGSVHFLNLAVGIQIPASAGVVLFTPD